MTGVKPVPITRNWCRGVRIGPETDENQLPLFAGIVAASADQTLCWREIGDDIVQSKLASTGGEISYAAGRL